MNKNAYESKVVVESTLTTHYLSNFLIKCLKVVIKIVVENTY